MVRFVLHFHKKLMSSILILIILIAISFNKVSGQSRTDSMTVNSIVEKYQSVWDTHDAYELAQLFTDDADIIMGNWPHISGRKVIQDRWQAYFNRQEAERKLRIDVNSFKIITEVVILINVTTTTWGHDSQGNELQSRRFRGSWVLKKQPNKNWLIVAMYGMPTEEDRIIRPSDH